MSSSSSTWAWSTDVAYAVGLVATDGCVLRSRPITLFTSKDRELVALLLQSLGLRKTIYRKMGGFGSWTYQTEIHDASLHRWLNRVGVMPGKSLTLGAIDVPEAFFVPFVRGLLDGDGSIMSYVHAPNRRRYPLHVYRRLTTRFYSASKSHLEWLALRLRALDVLGSISTDSRASRAHALDCLQLGKRASRTLLAELYRDHAAPALARKRSIWFVYLTHERDDAYADALTRNMGIAPECRNR